VEKFPTAYDDVGSSAAPITPYRLSLVLQVEFHVAFEVSIGIGSRSWLLNWPLVEGSRNSPE
jgi:hypothetical protein